ncbi:long-chain-fatty-acid--CoA ligase [Intrasporangium sp. DVR]|uniref:long-chain-fatty-acid--CoA ligase n=1 Tax=Intrasporangium sp. DVR TaxID=3127867 RepID=UPI003341072F
MERIWLDSYAEGVPSDIEPVTGPLTDLLDGAVTRFPDRTALEFFGAETTYAQLGDQVSRAAEGLRRLGVGKGDRVALVLPNCPQHVVAFYAALRLGAVVVEHNPLYTSSELATQFTDHGAEVAIAWDKVAPTVGRLPGVRHVVAVNLVHAMPVAKRLALTLPVPRVRALRSALTSPAPGAVPWGQLLRQGHLDPGHPRPTVDDLAAIQYTSGTTGVPKGAMLTHGNLGANAAQGRAWVPGMVAGAETIYAILPMFHAYGLTLCVTFAVSAGARLVLFPRFDIDLVLAAARKHPPTFLPAVPPIYAQLAAAASEQGVDLSACRWAISGAMTLPPETLELWESVTGGLLVEGYGLTEASPVALGNPIGPSRRAGAVGVPFPSTEIRVVDPDQPDVDRPRGELLIRGPQVFTGYWRRPEETAMSLLDGGWLRTGDIVEVDDDGFVHVVDRIKEIIITGGFNVMPSEVETVLKLYPGITDAAVVGLPKEDGSEQVVAAVTVADRAAFDADAAREHCREHLAAYKIPRRVEVVEELPKTIIGKVLRRHIREELMAR